MAKAKGLLASGGSWVRWILLACVAFSHTTLGQNGNSALTTRTFGTARSEYQHNLPAPSIAPSHQGATSRGQITTSSHHHKGSLPDGRHHRKINLYARRRPNGLAVMPRTGGLYNSRPLQTLTAVNKARTFGLQKEAIEIKPLYRRVPASSTQQHLRVNNKSRNVNGIRELNGINQLGALRSPSVVSSNPVSKGGVPPLAAPPSTELVWVTPVPPGSKRQDLSTSQGTRSLLQGSALQRSLLPSHLQLPRDQPSLPNHPGSEVTGGGGTQLTRGQLQSLASRVSALEEAVSSLHRSDTAIATQSMHHGRLISEFFWLINGIDRILSAGKDAFDKTTKIKSSPFYTHPRGYLLDIEMHPFSTLASGSAEIYIHLLPGRFDGELQWPVSYTFDVAIVDQAPEVSRRDHVIRNNSCVLRRIRSNGADKNSHMDPMEKMMLMSSEYGCGVWIRHSILGHRSFKRNGNIVIKITTYLT